MEQDVLLIYYQKKIIKIKLYLGTESGNLESKILEEKLVETKIGFPEKLIGMKFL